MLLPVDVQAALRAKLGEETTTFERITDGTRTVCRGDVVRVNAKPQLVGRVLHFTIPQVGTRAADWCFVVSLRHVSVVCLMGRCAC